MSGRATSNRLGDATWTELEATGDAPILLVPIGSCEQHGPHLPLDTDTRIATAIAEAVARRSTGVLVAPAVAITASGEHQGFPGTLSIGVEATTAVLVELVRSADWSGGVVFVNGHGGNLAAVTAAVTVAKSEGRQVLSWWPRVADGDAHAGRTETSLMLAIDPGLVRRDAAVSGVTTPITDLIDDLRVRGLRSTSPSGVLGDPTGASAEEGAELLEVLVADAVERLGQWRAERRR